MVKKFLTLLLKSKKGLVGPSYFQAHVGPGKEIFNIPALHENICILGLLLCNKIVLSDHFAIFIATVDPMRIVPVENNTKALFVIGRKTN